jgi:hypothetical protein
VAQLNDVNGIMSQQLSSAVGCNNPPHATAWLCFATSAI